MKGRRGCWKNIKNIGIVHRGSILENRATLLLGEAGRHWGPGAWTEPDPKESPKVLGLAVRGNKRTDMQYSGWITEAEMFIKVKITLLKYDSRWAQESQQATCPGSWVSIFYWQQLVGSGILITWGGEIVSGFF